MKNAPSYNLHGITGDIMLLKKPPKNSYGVVSVFSIGSQDLKKKKKQISMNLFFRGEVWLTKSDYLLGVDLLFTSLQIGSKLK